MIALNHSTGTENGREGAYVYVGQNVPTVRKRENLSH